MVPFWGLVLVWTWALVVGATGQTLGDPAQGLEFARQNCASCHAVERGEGRKFGQSGASFETIAKTPGMTAMALSVWFRSPHPNMPQLVLSDNERDDVIAYITSLKR